jgi:hypothetical protein
MERINYVKEIWTLEEIRDILKYPDDVKISIEDGKIVAEYQTLESKTPEKVAESDKFSVFISSGGIEAGKRNAVIDEILNIGNEKRKELTEIYYYEDVTRLVDEVLRIASVEEDTRIFYRISKDLAIELVNRLRKVGAEAFRQKY